MLLDIVQLLKQYNIKPDAVLQPGAHYGQEQSIYDELGIPDDNRFYFEPQKRVFEVLKQNVGSRGHLYNIALGNFNGESEMFVENNNESMSSSLLRSKIHSIQYPHIVFDQKETVKVHRLDDIFPSNRLNHSWFINCDTQGYELEVFKGAVKLLPYAVAILCEVNRDELYEGCARIEEIDHFLSQFGFSRMETNFAGISWGDSLYIKKC